MDLRNFRKMNRESQTHAISLYELLVIKKWTILHKVSEEEYKKSRINMRRQLKKMKNNLKKI